MEFTIRKINQNRCNQGWHETVGVYAMVKVKKYTLNREYKSMMEEKPIFQVSSMYSGCGPGIVYNTHKDYSNKEILTKALLWFEQICLKADYYVNEETKTRVKVNFSGLTSHMGIHRYEFVQEAFEQAGFIKHGPFFNVRHYTPGYGTKDYQVFFFKSFAENYEDFKVKHQNALNHAK